MIKFDADIPVYWLSHQHARDRHVHMIDQFFHYGISQSTLVGSYDSSTIWQRTPTTRYLHSIENQALTIALNHLNIINRFYQQSTSELALIFEDDIDLSISKYWTFSLSELIKQLPTQWAAIQLCLIRKDSINDVRFRPMLDSDWSAAAYLISRSHAKRLVETYIVGRDCYNIDAVTRDFGLIMAVEAVLFCLDWENMYTFPIFTEKLSLPSTFYQNGLISSVHKSLNLKSAHEVRQWWESNGLIRSLESFFSKSN